ncbi:MAG: hypothetical protein KDE54_35455 [Caldilineaceae bacterium]|nr:hypothetical protein [Caldilineaceae bacterium]MCB0096686.1 hypothetical protein [Caldilineaceae bacterium]MCB0139494.1 hypothetical protein [Caldilineaceae bacterium]MCB9147791.1 hypothetical protein [Caldilineaceae bacterium]
MIQFNPRDKSSTLYQQFMVGVVLLAVGLAFAFPPRRLKGPSVISLGGGHGITVSDLVALVPLTAAVALIGLVLWKLRGRLRQRASALLAVGGAEIFLIGLSTGILLNGAVLTLDWKSGEFLTWMGIAGLLGATMFYSARRKGNT